MSDELHVRAVLQGQQEMTNWQRANPGIRFDLSGADLRGKDLSGRNLGECDLSGANLDGANLERTNLGRAKLAGASLRGARLDKARLTEVSLKMAPLDRASLTQATIEDADFTEASLVGADLFGCSISSSTLVNAKLESGNLVGAQLGPRINLRGASLSGARIHLTHFDHAILRDADITGADFFEAKFSAGELSGVKGAEQALNLDTVDVQSEPKYFEHCERRWPERFCDWERLRTFGRMPLFGLSYTVLIFIPVYCYVIAWYNHQVERLRDASLRAERHIPGQPTGPGHVADAIGQYLHPLPLPSLSLVLLASTVMLAIASTIYTFWCPPRIKEFTRDVWCDQLRRSLLHYWPTAWKYRRLRLACGFFYLAGGLGALFVLVVKVWNAGAYIVRHTPFPW